MRRVSEGTAPIRAHSETNTLIISKYSNYAKPINHRINLIVGMGARCMGGIYIKGNLELGKKAMVTGDVKAKNVVLGPQSIIKGDLDVVGDLYALDNSIVTGRVTCGGSAIIRPGVAFKSLDASGLVEVYGKLPSRDTRGKMIVNKENV